MREQPDWVGQPLPQDIPRAFRVSRRYHRSRTNVVQVKGKRL